MPSFQYTALNDTGKRIEGVLAGASEQAVLMELEARQLVPVSIEERAESRPLWQRGVSTRQLATSYTQMADLLRAGVPLLRTLKVLGNRRSQPRLAAVFSDLGEAVSQGGELAEAMAMHPEVFPRIHIAMVRAGEKGGFLEAVLTRLGQFVLAQAELRGKVVGNLVYPAFLIVAGGIILGVVFGIFVPMIKPLLMQNPSLPFITRVVFGVSSLVADYGLYTLAALAVAAVAAWRVCRRPDVRMWLARRSMKLPVYGPLARSLAAARFCRLLGTMLANGIPLLTAMQISKDAAGNVLMEEAIDKAAESVRAGAQLAPPLAESGLFGDDVVEMISVGESANNLDEVLTTIAATIESGIDRMLTTAIRLLEPLLLLVIALVVVIMAAALLLPMTQMQTGL